MSCRPLCAPCNLPSTQISEAITDCVTVSLVDTPSGFTLPRRAPHMPCI